MPLDEEQARGEHAVAPQYRDDPLRYLWRHPCVVHQRALNSEVSVNRDKHEVYYGRHCTHNVQHGPKRHKKRDVEVLWKILPFGDFDGQPEGLGETRHQQIRDRQAENEPICYCASDSLVAIKCCYNETIAKKGKYNEHGNGKRRDNLACQT